MSTLRPLAKNYCDFKFAARGTALDARRSYHFQFTATHPERGSGESGDATVLHSDNGKFAFEN